MSKENPRSTGLKNAWAIRVNNKSHLICLRWGAFKQYNTPFRYNSKWWRKSNSNSKYAIAIKTKITKRYVKIADIEKESFSNSKFMVENDVIATFAELISENERKQKIADVILT